MRYSVKWINLVVVQLWNCAAYVIQDFIAIDECNTVPILALLNILD